MTFFNPMVLFGLFAAAIPLILHLLNLRKLKRIEFSSLKFLKELQKTKIKKLKLKRLLLLLLRTLAIASIVLAFARPTINNHLPLLGNYANTSSVILFDNSASTNVSDEYGNRFNQSKNTVRSILSTMKEGDETAIIPMCQTEHSGELLLSRNHEFTRRDLENIKISFSKANLEQSLRLATDLLHNSLNFTREVFIVSDLQSNIFHRELKDSSRFAKAISNFFIFPIGSESKTDLKNVSIDSIRMITQIFQKDKPVEAEFTVNNHSTSKIEGLVVSLYYNQAKTSQRSIDLQAGEKKTITISAIPQSAGLNTAYIELESDALDEDNKAYFGFIIPDRPKVALVANPAQSKYLRLSLSAKMYNQPLVDLQEFTPNALASMDMNKYDIVVCAGGPYRETDFQRLKQYANNGGSIMFFADNSTPRDIFNLGMNELGFGMASERLFAEDQKAQFTKVDKEHPIFRGVFKGNQDSREIVESPKITKANTVLGGLQIIEIPGGAFLSESKIGEGKAIYCAVTPDAEWSNLPFTGIFPTMVFRSVSYLSSKQDAGKMTKAGESININIPKKYTAYSNFKVIDPNGNETFIQTSQMPSGAMIALDNLNYLGNYKILTLQNEPVAVVSVNHYKSESDLNLFDKSKTKEYINSISSDQANIRWVQSIKDLKSELNSARIGTELWQLFVVIALICLVLEMLVAKNSKFETEEGE